MSLQPQSMGMGMKTSTSMLNLDDMVTKRKNDNDFMSALCSTEISFDKPIEEVYEGVHDGPVLGSGVSGVVRKITHRETGEKFAVKCLDLGLVNTKEGLQQLREEIFIMCQLDHPNIVKLEEVYESQKEIYLVQELCLGGELFDRLDDQPDYHYTEGQCARLVKQMLCAVRYIHSKGIIHRDLKLENFLFSDTTQDAALKMIDFGLSKHFTFGEVMDEAVGTPYTVAPEVIKSCYDERCDVWGIGVITFLLLSGESPFGGCDGVEPLSMVKNNILRGHVRFEPEDIWVDVSDQAKQFILKLLVTDPNQRPTAREAQTSSWLQHWAHKDMKHEDNKLSPSVVKALVNFKGYGDMRKLLCELLSFTLLPDQIAELRKEFEKMDTDGSGEISLSVLKEVLMGNASSGTLGGITEEEVEDIFNAMRVRKSATKINWHDFISAGISQCKVDERNIRLAFDRLDSYHKGYITFEDFADIMGGGAAQTEEALRNMWGDSMKAVNCKDAHITYDDFLLLMKGQTKVNTTPAKRDTASSFMSALEPLNEAHADEDDDFFIPDEDEDEQDYYAPDNSIFRHNSAPPSATDASYDTKTPDNTHVSDVEVILDGDNKTTPHVVNRQPFCAYRQMRLAVLDASKRFEEEKARRANLQQETEKETNNNTNQPSSERDLNIHHTSSDQNLAEEAKEELSALAIANKRGGRGRDRRARKRTVSDIGGMLSLNSHSVDNTADSLKIGSDHGGSFTTELGGYLDDFVVHKTPSKNSLFEAVPIEHKASVPRSYRQC
uniref:Calmodulin n=1 Tax=Ditylum brightwellii TaxID=49249 RepID=A0A7S2A6B0_9STRA